MSKKREVIEFGAELRRRRHELNLSLEQFAERAGLTPNFIGSIEKGQRDPSLSTLTKLAQGLGISVRVLLGTETSLSPEAEEFAKMFSDTLPQVQVGQLMILRVAAKLGSKAPSPRTR